MHQYRVSVQVILSAMLVSVGEPKADPFEAPVGQLTLDEVPPPTIDRHGGGAAVRFATWAARLGEDARFIAAAGGDQGRAHLLSLVAKAGVHVCTASGDDPDFCLEGVSLLHLEAADLFAAHMAGLTRQAIDEARRRGALVSLELSDTGWIRAHGAPRTAYQLATLRPDLIFASEEAAGELGAPLEGIAGVAVTRLGTRGCTVFGRFVIAPDSSELTGSALAAAFCVAYLEGATPLEAAGRAVLFA